MERGMGAAAEQDRMAGRGQERRAKQQEGRESQEGDHGTRWERERENKGKEGVESCQTVKEGGPPLLS